MRVVGVHALVLALVACDAHPTRMRVEQRVVRAGEGVIVKIDPPSIENRSIALVRDGAPGESERVFVDRGAHEAIVTATEPGDYELVLREGVRVIARAQVTIERTPVARQEPPIWYW